MPHAQRANRDRWHPGDPLPLGGRAAAVLVAVLAILILLILFVKDANGNFVYWSSGSPNSSIGRVKINGVGQNNNFITGLNDPHGVAVDSRFIYWSQGDTTTGSIGRANLDGSAPNPNFIPHSAGVSDPSGVALTPTAIYWQNGSTAIGRANIDAGAPVTNFINTSNSNCGLAADSSFLYFLNNGGGNVGRATLDGTSVDGGFITIPEAFCGLAVDPSFLYWASDSGNTVGRVPVGGGTPQGSFVPAGTTGGGPTGVAVNSQYVFWGNHNASTIGRANINGSAPNPALVAGASITGPPSSNASLLAAAPSNKVTVNSIKKKKKKGTAVINAKVPGPGQVTLSQTAGAQDPNAIAAAVKQVGLTITGASSFKLPIKPLGKTKKKLKKKGKAGVKVFITFVPAGVAGVPNTDPVKTKLIKKRKKTKKK
jgi:hypothetical protein